MVSQCFIVAGITPLHSRMLITPGIFATHLLFNASQKVPAGRQVLDTLLRNNEERHAEPWHHLGWGSGRASLFFSTPAQPTAWAPTLPTHAPSLGGRHNLLQRPPGTKPKVSAHKKGVPFPPQGVGYSRQVHAQERQARYSKVTGILPPIWKQGKVLGKGKGMGWGNTWHSITPTVKCPCLSQVSHLSAPSFRQGWHLGMPHCTLPKGPIIMASGQAGQKGTCLQARQAGRFHPIRTPSSSR